MSDQLHTVLDRARSLGFLGPGSVASQVEHARLFLAGVRDAAHILDLGSGGGVPGLVVAVERPASTGVLFDGMDKRTAFLRLALRQLGVDHWSVERGRAEDLSDRVDRLGAFDVVTARGFGPPSATLECGLPLLSSGGVLLISEPPGRRRWPTDVLDELGVEVDESMTGIVGFRRTGDPVTPTQRTWKRITSAPRFVVHD